MFAITGRAGPGDAPARPLTRGRIALEFEAAEVMFRNVMIRPLDAADKQALRAG